MKLTLYDAVERGAIRNIVPRLELWKKAAQAIVAGDLKVTNAKNWAEDGTDPGPKWMAWCLNLLKRDEDPNVWGGSHHLRRITVDKRQFDAWLRRATKAPTGPRRGASGYASADRRHFPAITKMKKNGEARSAFGAAKILYRKGLIKGASEQSTAKRVASRYLNEHSS